MQPPLTKWVEQIAATISSINIRTQLRSASTFSTPRPPWCVSSDPLTLVFREKRRLLSTGQVKLASVLRSGEILKLRSPVHGAADVLYHAEDEPITTTEIAATELALVRQNLLKLLWENDSSPQTALWGNAPQSQSLGDDGQRFTEFLQTDDRRGFGIRVPETLSPDVATAVTSMFVYRYYLPGGRLTRSVLPVLVAPDPPRVALPVPKTFWPDEMFDWWLA